MQAQKSAPAAAQQPPAHSKTNKLLSSYMNQFFMVTFVREIDQEFKSYNKFLRRENMEMRLKTSKKEKVKFASFLAEEEAEFWSGFPNERSFFKRCLQKVREFSSQGQIDYQQNISALLNVLPEASQQVSSRLRRQVVFQADRDIEQTFDAILESLNLFDSEDLRNWHILSFIVSQIVGELIIILLEKMPQNSVNQGLLELLLATCQNIACYRVEPVEDESPEDPNVAWILLKQNKRTWGLLFGEISKLIFNPCMKFLMGMFVNNDFNLITSLEQEDLLEKIYFCRFLYLKPQDKHMAASTLNLLDSINNLLLSKGIKENLKMNVVYTLVSLLKPFVTTSDEEPDYDSPMGVLLPVIETLFKVGEKLSKKDSLREASALLMVTIAKTSPTLRLFNDRMQRFYKIFKPSQMLESKKTSALGLQLMTELLSGHQVFDQQTSCSHNHTVLLQLAGNSYLPYSSGFRELPVLKSRSCMSFRDTFRPCFSQKYFSGLTDIHMRYLETMAFEDLDHLTNQAIPQLLMNLKSMEQPQYVLFALKIAKFLIEPTHQFLPQYSRFWKTEFDSDIMKVAKQQLKGLKQYVSMIIKEVLRSQAYFKSDFFQDLHHFFKSDERENCQDQLGVFWCRSKENMYKSSREQAQQLRKKGAGVFFLQSERRILTFEDHRELEVSPDYLNAEMVKIADASSKTIQAWDKRKEEFTRKRLVAHLSEERKEGQRQNTQLYNFQDSAGTRAAELQIFREMLDLIPFLPEVHSYLCFQPLKSLAQNGSVSEKVPKLNYSDIDPQGPTILSQGQSIVVQDGQNEEEAKVCAPGQPLKKKKSEGRFQATYSNKFKEAENLLPYLLMFADYHTTSKASKTLQKIAATGSLETKCALLDQMLYFLKELMLDSPQEYLVSMYLQHTVAFVKMWHQMEKNKLVPAQGKNEKDFGLQIVKMDEFGKAEKQQDANEYSYLFDFLDMICLLSMSNKDKLVRQFAFVLLSESGKLRRLLMAPSQSNPSISDLLVNRREEIQGSVVKTLLVYAQFKQQNPQIFTKEGFDSLLKSTSFEQIVVDDFEYKQAGLSDSLVKDLNVLFIGFLAQGWLEEITKHKAKISSSVKSFIHSMSKRTLDLFESKQHREKKIKDYIGLNILLAFPLSNLTSQEEESEEIEHLVRKEQQSLISQLLKMDFNDTFKASFGSFYPSKFQISSILLGCLFIRDQTKIHELFSLESKDEHLKNSEIFFSLYSGLELKGDKKFWTGLLSKFQIQENQDEKTRKLKLRLKLNYLINVVNSLDKRESQILPPKDQQMILDYVRQEHNRIENEGQTDMLWLLPGLRKVWQQILSFGDIFQLEKVNLDLKFLLILEKQGADVLQFYRTNQGQVEFSSSDLKELIEQIFLFYNNAEHLTDHKIRNPYFECFVEQVLGGEKLVEALQTGDFEKIYTLILDSCIRQKAKLDYKLKKFEQLTLHSKFFIVGLFMAVNSLDQATIRKARALCLATLPLQFPDSHFRETIESALSNQDISQLINSENKQMFRFIKQSIRDEEQYNLRHHFEKYFALSGFLRNTLNEIIKLQKFEPNEKALLKFLDILTYFFGPLQLRRAPVTDESAFVFDNLIDYKSFEFLDKIFRITEKLFDFDDSQIVLNLWWKLVEGRQANFEVLAKFLVHNLAVFQAKKHREHTEYEKFKRYSFTIFNSVKSRVAVADTRNSLQLSEHSVCWAQRMTKLLKRSSLNICSKYTLEKLKLKQILGLLHQELNVGSTTKLRLKGGLHCKSKGQSLQMSSLLQSQTFLDTFSGRNRKDETIMKNLLFRVTRIVREQFELNSSTQSAVLLPSLVIRYFESALIFIANDAERPTQLVRFKLKDELVIAGVVLILLTHMLLNPNKKERATFLFQVFKKCAVHIPGIQKYFNLELNNEDLFDEKIPILDRLFKVFQYKEMFDHFHKFAKIFFNLMSNLSTVPRLVRSLLYFFQNLFLKLKTLAPERDKNPVNVSTVTIRELSFPSLTFNRKLFLTILESAYHHLYEAAKHVSVFHDDDWLRLQISNQSLFLQILSEYVSPSENPPLNQSNPGEVNSQNVAFATNAVFWLSMAGLETAAKTGEKKELPSYMKEYQGQCIAALQKLLSSSEFIKGALVNLSRLSPNFLSYSLSVSKGQLALLPLLFKTLENQKCLEDTLKCLITTTRIQDTTLLSLRQQDQPSDEIQRFLFLLPFFEDQFKMLLDGKEGKKVFSNYKSILSLLKKSLPSLGIHEKKQIYEQLDQLQRAAETQADFGQIEKEFELVAQAAIREAKTQNLQENLLSCKRVLKQMKQSQAAQKIAKTIEVELQDSEGLKELDFQAAPFVGDIHGEEVAGIREHLRPLYFGMKNIIIKEIENIDKEIDVQEFFTGIGKPVEMKAQISAPVKVEEPKVSVQKLGLNTEKSIPQSNDGNFSEWWEKLGPKAKEVKETAAKYSNSKTAGQGTQKTIQILGQDAVSLASAAANMDLSSSNRDLATQALAQANNSSKPMILKNTTMPLTAAASPTQHTPQNLTTKDLMKSTSAQDQKAVYLETNPPPFQLDDASVQSAMKAEVQNKDEDDINQQDSSDEADPIREPLDSSSSQEEVNPNIPGVTPLNEAQETLLYSGGKKQQYEKQQQDQRPEELIDDARSKLKEVLEEANKKLEEDRESHYNTLARASFAPSAQEEGVLRMNESHASSHSSFQVHQVKEEVKEMETQTHGQDQHMEYMQNQFYQNTQPLQQQYQREEVQRVHHYQTMAEPPRTPQIQETPKQTKKERITDIAINPNYVAERASKIFSQTGSQNFDFGDAQSVQSESKLFKAPPVDASKQAALAQYPWLQTEQKPKGQSKFDSNNQMSQQIPVYAEGTLNPYRPKTQAMGKAKPKKAQPYEMTPATKQHQRAEELPTPKRSNKLETKLINVLCNQTKYNQFQEFLEEKKQFDVDYLHFYVKIMEFKKEQDVERARLAAGILIDSFLTEEAAQYISFQDGVVQQITNDFEQACATQRPIKEKLFDQAFTAIEADLTVFLEEFRQQQE